MPNKLRRISGDELVKLLCAQGFRVLRQKGSQVRLAFASSDATYLVTVPLHSELDRGTLKSIVRSLERALSEEVIQKLFYTE